MKSDHVNERVSQLVSFRRRSLAVRRRAAQLRVQAEAAREHAVAAVRDAELLRCGLAPRREAREFQAERARGTSELASYVAALREATALQDAWFRDQALDMLNHGWGRAELAEIGFGEEFLAELGLLDHPALRAPRGSPVAPAAAAIPSEGVRERLRLSIIPVAAL